uniref:SFRICE_014588 n=1 Tax=Spodoptera frugiperda TaxID=7108 RepID=A0A2H1VN21_SPOFR
MALHQPTVSINYEVKDRHIINRLHHILARCRRTMPNYRRTEHYTDQGCRIMSHRRHITSRHRHYDGCNILGLVLV